MKIPYFVEQFASGLPGRTEAIAEWALMAAYSVAVSKQGEHEAEFSAGRTNCAELDDWLVLSGTAATDQAQNLPYWALMLWGAHWTKNGKVFRKRLKTFIKLYDETENRTPVSGPRQDARVRDDEQPRQEST